MQQKIIILDFGSQTTQLIGRRVRELDTFCEIMPYNKFPKDDPSVIGVILSGSPYSHLDPAKCKMYAFSGIHMVAPSVFPLMEEEPDKFPIMDFYLKHCDKVRIEGYVKNDLKLMDVGKQETLKEAEAFLKELK